MPPPPHALSMHNPRNAASIKKNFLISIPQLIRLQFPQPSEAVRRRGR